MTTALTPISRGLLYAAIGLGIGILAAWLLIQLTDRDSFADPLITLGYLFAAIGWLMGVGIWKTWGT